MGRRPHSQFPIPLPPTSNLYPRSECLCESVWVRSKLLVLSIRAKGRKVAEAGPVYPLREPQVSYLTDFGLENDAIGAEKTCFWNV